VIARARPRIAELERQAAFDLEPFIDLAEDDSTETETDSVFYDALSDNEAAGNAFYARSQLDCIAAAPAIERAMGAALDHPRPRVRAIAAMGAVALAKDDLGKADALGPRLLALAQAAIDSDERSAHVLALGDLGVSPVAFLRDPSSAVRMCAALAPSLAGDGRATDELIGALERHAREIDGWFVEKPFQFATKPRFYVVARLLERVEDFDRLAGAAIAVARVTEKFAIDHDWGPLLAAAFRKGGGVVETEAQRRFLAALVDNADLWDPKLGNASKWFTGAGLRYDRDVCAQLAGRA
jgi:hypothetical protein